MADFALVPTSALGIEGDLRVEGSGYRITDGLETAIRLSLFTDARAQEGDDLPEGTGAFGEDLRGWWGSAFLSDSGEMGSRLWTLKRSALTAGTRQRARDYCLEALRWLIDLGIAREVRVETEVADAGVLKLGIEIERERETPARFAYLWEL